MDDEYQDSSIKKDDIIRSSYRSLLPYFMYLLLKRALSLFANLFGSIEDIESGIEHMNFSEFNEIKRGLQLAKVDVYKSLRHFAIQ